MVAASSDLRRLLSSPVITREEQRRAMAAVLDKAGIGAITRNFVLVVAQNHRLLALPAMIEAYLAELARRRGEIAAQVHSARTPSDAPPAALLGTRGARVVRQLPPALKVRPALSTSIAVPGVRITAAR